MKTKNSIKITIALAILLLITSFKVSAQQSNFSGNWQLNEQKSDFNGQPSETMFKQIRVSQTKDSLTVTGTRFDSSKGSSIITYALNGKTITAQLTGTKKMNAYLKWTDGKTLTRYSSYYSGDDPQQVDYRSEEAWSLAADGKTLTLKRTFIKDTGPVSITAVYDKL